MSATSIPSAAIGVVRFPAGLGAVCPKPDGALQWPPTQLTYLEIYLRSLGCATIVVETHYVDRDFVDDFARYYARALRSYPNFTTRLHFFNESFTEDAWRAMIAASADGQRDARTGWLQDRYLGFCVVRPLPASPIGRTVLRAPGSRSDGGHERVFGGAREYSVHLCGLDLKVVGLAFQQQDQGVSACATTALWSALQCVASAERLHMPTPGEITDAASRYVLTDGRSMPSEGLRVEQICEATRAAGLAPLVVRSVSPEQDRVQLMSYVRSRFAPVLALSVGGIGHAVCCVGLKLGDIRPQTNPSLHFRDAASRVEGLYIHDDRLGPYASAELFSDTRPGPGNVRTSLMIRWPDNVESEQAILQSIIVPLPPKVRLSVTRMRALGLPIAEVAAALDEIRGPVTLDVRYERAVQYKQRAYEFCLSAEGLYQLLCELPLSRYVGLIEISSPAGPLFDVVLDTTDSGANPCALAVVRRAQLPAAALPQLEALTAIFGSRRIV